MHTVVKGCQLTIYHAAGVCRELCDQFIASPIGKCPWSTKSFVLTVGGIERNDVARSGIFADGFCDKHPREWTKHALITLDEATEVYMVEVIAQSHCLKQQLISSRYSTCLLRWQGKEVVYSWKSLTCAWLSSWPQWPKEGFRTPQCRKHNT